MEMSRGKCQAYVKYNKAIKLQEPHVREHDT